MSPTTPRRLSLVSFPTPPGVLPALPELPVAVTLTHPDYAPRGALQLPDGQILAGRTRGLASAWARQGWSIAPAAQTDPHN